MPISYIEWAFGTPPNTQPDAGRGIRWYKPGNNVKMADLELYNIAIHRSPNLAFEFVCDGDVASYVSKLVMVECLAFEAASGGSVKLGGAGTNNNFLERCEFNGPGFGWYHNVVHCAFGVLSTTITSAGYQPFDTIQIGDEVAGMGIAVGTTVISISPAKDSVTISKPTIAAYPIDVTTTLTFYTTRLPDPTSFPYFWLPRGQTHLMRTFNTRFHHSSFQGPGTTPVLSTDLISNHLVLRDSYREKNTDAVTAYCFMINGLLGFLVDGLIHQCSHQSYNETLLVKTGPGGVRAGRITNALLFSGRHGVGAIWLNDPAHEELVVDNSTEASPDEQDLAVAGSIVQATAQSFPPGDPNAANSFLIVPNGNDEFLAVLGASASPSPGTKPLIQILPIHTKRRITLILGDSTQLTSNALGGNLRLASSTYTGSAQRTVTLVCDGAFWLELGRSTYL